MEPKPINAGEREAQDTDETIYILVHLLMVRLPHKCVTVPLLQLHTVVCVECHCDKHTEDHPHRDGTECDEGITVDAPDLRVVDRGVCGEGGAFSWTVCAPAGHVAMVRVLVGAVQHGGVVVCDVSHVGGGGGGAEVVLECEGCGASLRWVPHEGQPLLTVACGGTGATKVANHRDAWGGGGWGGAGGGAV